MNNTSWKTILGVAILYSFFLASASADGMTAERHQAVLAQYIITMQKVIGQGPYQPTVKSLDNYSAPDWYADAKLGIFIHYGLFSVPGFSGVGCWYGNHMYDPKRSAYAFHRQEYGPQDTFGYKDFAPFLTASKFNADEWVSLFKEAGARFVVPVSCFHDGFAMWDSKLTDWNTVKIGPKRDYDGLLAEAARKQGMKFGVAWHAFFRPSFFKTGRREGTDIKPPNSGTPWSIYGPDTVTPEFVKDGLGRLVELVDGYQPDLVWFDFDTRFVKPSELRKFAAFYFNRAAEWGKGVAINDKNETPSFFTETSKWPGAIKDQGTPFPESSVVLDFERGKTVGIRSKLWQTDTSVSWKEWSYIRNENFKTADELVHELVDIVSKNGVLLLDIGPRPDGSIPPEPQALLRALGAWLKVNGEAIYGTRPCWALGFGEGSHNSGGGGFSDRSVEYDAHDFRFTQKNNVVYAIAFNWPDVDDHFLIHSFNERTTVATGGITAVRLLGCHEATPWSLTKEGLLIQRPKDRPCDGAYAFEITLAGVTLETIAGQRINDRQIRVNFQLRNLDNNETEQPVELFANNKTIGRGTYKLGALKTITGSIVCEVPSSGGSEKITASSPNGKPFFPHCEIQQQDNTAATGK